LDSLPILYENRPAMSLCGICPKPGACCKDFTISKITYWIDEGLEAAQKDFADRGLPFQVIGWRRETWKSDEDDGREYGEARCDCPKLTADGRCSIYSTRPKTCSNYEPASDGLCVMHGILKMDVS